MGGGIFIPVLGLLSRFGGTQAPTLYGWVAELRKASNMTSGEVDLHDRLFDWTAAPCSATRAVPSGKGLTACGSPEKIAADKISESYQHVCSLLIPWKEMFDSLLGLLYQACQVSLYLLTGFLSTLDSILGCTTWFSKGGQAGRWAQNGDWVRYGIDGFGFWLFGDW